MVLWFVRCLVWFRSLKWNTPKSRSFLGQNQDSMDNTSSPEPELDDFLTVFEPGERAHLAHFRTRVCFHFPKEVHWTGKRARVPFKQTKPKQMWEHAKGPLSVVHFIIPARTVLNPVFLRLNSSQNIILSRYCFYCVHSLKCSVYLHTCRTNHRLEVSVLKIIPAPVSARSLTGTWLYFITRWMYSSLLNCTRAAEQRGLCYICSEFGLMWTAVAARRTIICSPLRHFLSSHCSVCFLWAALWLWQNFTLAFSKHEMRLLTATQERAQVAQRPHLHAVTRASSAQPS